MLGNLYIVATPIGNLSDMSFRAVDILKSVDYIFCEDTRVTGKLLKHYEIDTRMISYHSFSGEFKIKKAISLLKENKDIALVSDAGVPTISDPGVKLVKSVRDTLGDSVKVLSVPGACSVVSALSVSGAPSSSFVFLGFLPRKKGRKTLFEEIAKEDKTVVFFESPHRLIKTLESLKENLGEEKEVIVVREITKIYEESVSGNAEEVLQYYMENKEKNKGEIVIIISSLERK